MVKIDELTGAPFQGNLTVYVHVVERRSVNWTFYCSTFSWVSGYPAHHTHGLRSRYGTPVERVNMCDHMLNKCANNICLRLRTSFNTIDEQTHIALEKFNCIQLFYSIINATPKPTRHGIYNRTDPIRMPFRKKFPETRKKMQTVKERCDHNSA
jgi:hypothetical protein